MTPIGTIGSFNAEDDFSKYKERMDQFFLANDIAYEKNAAMIITLMSPDCYKIMKSTLNSEALSAKTYAEFLSNLQGRNDSSLLIETNFIPVIRYRVSPYQNT